MGWYLTDYLGMGLDYNAGQVALHEGDHITHQSLIALLPEHKLGVIIMTNSKEGKKIHYKIAGEAFRELLETSIGITTEKKKGRVSVKIVPPRRLMLSDGYYDTKTGLVPVQLRYDGLVMTINGSKFRLVPRADDTFTLRRLMGGFFPVRIKKYEKTKVSFAFTTGEKILTSNIEGRNFFKGNKIDFAKISKKWSDRSGFYKVSNPGEDIVYINSLNLHEDHGFLMADLEIIGPKTKDKMSVALSPVTDYQASVSGLGLWGGEMISVIPEEGGEVIHLSGYSFEKISGKSKKGKIIIKKTKVTGP